MRMTYDELRERAISRFWSLVRPDPYDDDACWEWTGNTTTQGYGAFHIGRDRMNAHVFSWMLGSGIDRLDQIPMDPTRPSCRLSVAHSCDNRRCCNPRHLSLMTHKANMEDMVAKGRWAGSRSLWMRGGA